MLPKCFAVIILLSHQVTFTFTQTLMIINNPMDTTVCTGSVANISCGFVNDSANFVPNWRIIKRSSDGSVISNMTISGSDIISNVNDGLEYIPDTTSGPLMSPNSRLEVGPVDETHNQSSYQCSFALNGGAVESSVGTLTVTGGPPDVNSVSVALTACGLVVQWSEPSSDPVCGTVWYTVTISTEGGILIITDYTTMTNYNVTGLNNNTVYHVNVTASNNAGSSDPTGISVITNSIDFPTVTNIRTVSEICITSFNISWDISNSMTCGDISYEVSISPPPVKGNAIATTNNTFYSVTGLNNSLPNVTITVTVSNREGQENNRTFFVKLPNPRDPPLYNTTISSSTTPDDLSGFDIIISWTRPTIDPCTTLPITGYYIHAIVTSRNEDTNERIYTSNYIDDMLGGSMGEFNVSYNASFEQQLQPNANYIFIVSSQNNITETSRTDTRPSCNCSNESDYDGLSTGVAVAIGIVVTFIITLVVTALISIIITSLYYNYQYELKEKVKVDDDNTKHTNDSIPMDTNPAYGTTAIIKMDTDPAYATTT